MDKKPQIQGARRRENKSVADLGKGCGKEGFIRNHLREWAEITGGEKIKDATVAAKTRCRYQLCTVAFLSPLGGKPSINSEAFGFSVIAPPTVVERMSELS